MENSIKINFQSFGFELFVPISTNSKSYKSITSSLGMENINQEILNKINQIQIDIEFIKEKILDKRGRIYKR